MTRLAEYESHYERIAFDRSAEGILTMRVHTDGGPLQWSVSAHTEFGHAFADVAQDFDNRVVILTGTGDAFSGPSGAFGAPDQLGRLTSEEWSPIRTGTHNMLIHGLLRIEVPVIAAVNGPALRHAELPLLSDIVIAADTACFQDTAHFTNNTPPGDGQHVIMPLAMGINRARYYLLTGQSISAEKALEYGLVNEVVPASGVLDRARELATQLLQQPQIVLRNTRLILTQQIKAAMHDYLDYGLHLEGLGVIG